MGTLYRIAIIPANEMAHNEPFRFSSLACVTVSFPTLEFMNNQSNHTVVLLLGTGGLGF
jgi:hypothetical protein